jgi:exosortase J
MFAFPYSAIRLQGLRRWELSPAQFAAIGTVFAVLGLATIWTTVLTLWDLWMTDALKSIGMVVPIVSLILILRVWRTLGWQAEGTWWGFALLLITAIVERIQQQSVVLLVISPRWSTGLPPPSLMLLAYGSGVVLLLGGVRLYRAALFPILLLLLANPVPHVFSLLVDLPLQHTSAHIARALAMHMGYSLTPDHLRLMFTPDFGMFIAPGCDGLRGSVTMGFIALIAGYFYRFRWYATALVVMGAILLGYLFNLARLCLLVFYYVIALHIPVLQDKAEKADYAIGAALFLFATVLLFAVIHHLRDTNSTNTSATIVVAEPHGTGYPPSRMPVAQLAAMGAFLVFGGALLAQSRPALLPASNSAVAEAAAEWFPRQLGNYMLVRTWTENLSPAVVAYVWAQYAPADGGAPVAIGISPAMSWHDPLMCHFIRGEAPLWQGQLAVATADGVPINFSSAFYSDGVTQHIEAATICHGGTCGEFATERTHVGFIYTHLDSESLLSRYPKRPIPVLLRAETIDMAIPADAARQQLTGDLRAFLASVKLYDLTRPYNR